MELTDCLPDTESGNPLSVRISNPMRTNFCFFLFCDFGDGKKRSVVVTIMVLSATFCCW